MRWRVRGADCGTSDGSRRPRTTLPQSRLSLSDKGKVWPSARVKTRSSAPTRPSPNMRRWRCCSRRCARKASITFGGRLIERRPARVFGAMNRSPAAVSCIDRSTRTRAPSRSRRYVPWAEAAARPFRAVRGSEGCSGGAEPSPMHGGRTTLGEPPAKAFVAFDTSKMKHAVAIADGGRGGEVRFLGDISSSPATVERLIRKLAGRYGKLHFCYEARGRPGYGRSIVRSRLSATPCLVAAPALIPKRPGEQGQDQPARCGDAGAAAPGWRVDRGMGAGRGSRSGARSRPKAREAAADDLRRKRQQLLSFLLRHGRGLQRRRSLDAGGTGAGFAGQAFEHTAQQIVFQEGIDAIEERRSAPVSPGTAARRDRAKLVDGAGGGCLPGDARRLIPGGRHLCRRDRRCTPV